MQHGLFAQLTYQKVLKASPGAAIFGQDMLFDFPYLDD
jgi:hypothetical protein